MRSNPIKCIGNPSRDWRGQRGATVVEFAFIAALVLMIIFGILEYGLIFLQEHYVANASREAARIGVRANNFSSYGDLGKKGNCLNNSIPSWNCTDREWRVEREAVDYLNVFYDSDEVDVDVTFGAGSLFVEITIDKADIKKSGIVPFDHDISYTSSMAYEDQKEYEDEH